MSNLSHGDDELHDEEGWHKWRPPGEPDADADAAWIARVHAHVRTHRLAEPDARHLWELDDTPFSEAEACRLAALLKVIREATA